MRSFRRNVSRSRVLPTNLRKEFWGNFGQRIFLLNHDDADNANLASSSEFTGSNFLQMRRDHSPTSHGIAHGIVNALLCQRTSIAHGYTGWTESRSYKGCLRLTEVLYRLLSTNIVSLKTISKESISYKLQNVGGTSSVSREGFQVTPR